MQRPAGGDVGDEAGALLGGVGQLVEGIGQLEAGGEELEAQGGAGVGGVAPGQRRLGRRPMGEEGGAVAAEVGLHPFQQQAEEEILPALALPRRDADGGRRGAEGGGIAFGCQDIQAVAPAVEGLGHGQPLEGQAQVGGGIAMGDVAGADGADEGLGLVHQPGEAQAGGVPFQHGEFGGVARAGLAVAPDPGQLEDRAGAGDQQALQRQLGRGAEPEGPGLRRRRDGAGIRCGRRGGGPPCRGPGPGSGSPPR